MNLTADTTEAIRAHFTACFPNEGVGFVLTDGSFVALKNVAAEPLEHFQVDDADYEKYEDTLAAIVHSHPHNKPVGSIKPHDPRTPSHSDIQCHLDTGVPMGIVDCDAENINSFIWLGESHLHDVIGRDFIHGYFDCFSTCRDWYIQKYNLTIPNFARGVGWWNGENAANLYMDNFERAGFYVIDEEEVKPGDAVLLRVASRVVNHAGVVTNDGHMVHHLFNRLSCEERYELYRKGIVCFLRHKTLNQETNDGAS